MLRLDTQRKALVYSGEAAATWRVIARGRGGCSDAEVVAGAAEVPTCAACCDGRGDRGGARHACR